MRGFVTPVLSIAVLIVTPAAHATTWHVPSPECPTIQASIDSAGVGDTVLVACGTYTWTGEGTGDANGLIRMKSGITLRSETGQADCVTIDARNQGRVFFCDGVDTTASIEGFTIAGGYVEDVGGGGYCSHSSPRIANCTFYHNMAFENSGGGMYCFESHPSLTNCRFIENEVWVGYGGGVYCSDSSPTFTDCIFTANTADADSVYGINGGGLYCAGESSPVLVGCTFCQNQAPWGFGAGVCCDGKSAVFSNCAFSENTYGGVCSKGRSAVFSDCTFSGNTGEGMYCMSDSLAMLDHCAFAANDWGMVCWLSSPTLTNCTFSDNCQGMLLLEQCSPTLGNTIIARSTQGAAVVCGPACYPTLGCCDIFGNAGGDWTDCIADQLGVNGNFSADPLFCEPDSGDFRISQHSPCEPGHSGCGLVGADSIGCSVTSVAATEVPRPFELYLGPAIPNPFNPVTEITYGIPASGGWSQVTINVYDPLGRRVTTLVDTDQGPGFYAVAWHGRDHKGAAVASGVYFYRITWSGKSETKRMVLLR